MATSTADTAPVCANPQSFVKLPEVLALTTLSKTEIYRRIAAGTFPRQINIGPRSVVWSESEVRNWMAAQLDARGEAA